MDSEQSIDPCTRQEVRLLAEMIDALEAYEDKTVALQEIRNLFLDLSREEVFAILLIAVVNLHELIVTTSKAGAADVRHESDTA